MDSNWRPEGWMLLPPYPITDFQRGIEAGASAIIPYVEAKTLRAEKERLAIILNTMKEEVKCICSYAKDKSFCDCGCVTQVIEDIEKEVMSNAKDSANSRPGCRGCCDWLTAD